MRGKQLARSAQAVSVPVLLAISPILAVFEHNETEVAASTLWMPLAASAATAAAFFVVLLLVFRRTLTASVVASLLVVAAFYYGNFYDVVSGWGLGQAVFLPLWLVVIGLGVVEVARARNPAPVGRIALVMAVILVAIPVWRIARYRLDNPSVSTADPRLWSTSLQAATLTGNAPSPDIYLIVPDDYPRTDVLKKYFGYDNSPFILELKKRGFGIAEQGRSPYSDSEFNMASTLNLDYLTRFPTVLGRDTQNVLPVKQLIQDNRAARFLKSLGYRFIHLDSDNTTFAGDNPRISRFGALDNLTYLWLRSTILRPFWFSEDASNARFRGSVLSTFDRLTAVPETPGSKFVFFHVLPPHDPYVFGAQGQPVTFPDPSGQGGGSREGMRYFLAQLRFMNQKILESVDQILAHSTSPPIIIIQSDEGFETNEETFGEAVMRDIRVKGLSAFHLPGQDVSGLPQDLNIVNSFRYLFDLYFGTHFGMLPNHSYAEGDPPYNVEEIHVRGDPTPSPSPA